MTLAASFAHGLLLLSRGALSVGDLVAYMGLVGVLQFPAFISVFTLLARATSGFAGAERILELMRQETECWMSNAGGHTAPVEGEIVFENVSFGYGGGEGDLILRDITFTAKPGETVAIVGQTGSGKSTLTKLVNRVYDVSKGAHLGRRGGRARLEPRLAALAGFGHLSKTCFSLSRSVADNIAFGLGEADRGAVVEAAKAAQADGFIRHFLEGYDTIIGERGATLSGGQRQRLAIARALLTDPRILILDDATSAVDSATEDEIQSAINRVLEGRTTLMITHRLSQIRRADTILVLHQGALIDKGTHEELLGRCALYRRIFSRYED